MTAEVVVQHSIGLMFSGFNLEIVHWKMLAATRQGELTEPVCTLFTYVVFTE
jgi:hypothetical protein